MPHMMMIHVLPLVEEAKVSEWQPPLYTWDSSLISHVPMPDEVTRVSRKFLIPVESTLNNLLAREDTDHNMQITIDDAGPKVW